MSSAVGIDIRKVSHPSWHENVMEHLKESQRALQTLDIHGTLALAGGWARLYSWQWTWQQPFRNQNTV